MIWSAGLRLINVIHYARPLYGPTRLICICIGTDHRVVCSRGLLSERTSSCPELSIQPLPLQPRLPPSWLRPGRISRTENDHPTWKEENLLTNNDTEANRNPPAALLIVSIAAATRRSSTERFEDSEGVVDRSIVRNRRRFATAWAFIGDLLNTVDG